MPSLLLTGTLLFWGFWAHLLHFALALTLLLAPASRVGWRWEVSDREFDRLTDFTNLATVLTGAYLLYDQGSHGVFTLIKWLPILLFPLLAAQRYSLAGSIDLSSLFLSVRRLRGKGTAYIRRRIDFAQPYLAICLLAAAVAAPASPWFFPGAALLLAWGLFGVRCGRYRLATWLLLVALATATGYAGQLGLVALHGLVEQAVLEWMEGRFAAERDWNRQTTGIGEIGDLKFSNRIEWRLRVPEPAQAPALLRRASFQRFRYSTWSIRAEALTPLPREGAGDIWPLRSAVGPQQRLTLSGDLPRGRGLLPLPNGASRIQRLPAERVQVNALGAVLVEGAPEFVALPIDYQSDQPWEPPPTADDLEVTEDLRPLLAEVAEPLGLADLDAAGKAARLKRYFEEGFTYSLRPRGTGEAVSSLRLFFTQTRGGHCEYFATAGALLLRLAGVPTRYASGYAVEEYDRLSGSFLLRRRHAHAWTRAFIDGAWRDLDYTPSVWMEEEAKQTTWLRALADRLTLAWYGFQELWIGADEVRDNRRYAWLLVPLFLLLAWRLSRRPRRQIQPVRAGFGDVRTAVSPFDQVRARLEAQGHPPRPGETLQQWVRRLERDYGEAMQPALLQTALRLHYRLRFRPQGASTAEREELARRVAEWLAGRGLNRLA